MKFQAEETPYFGLGPDLILNALDDVGWRTTGTLMPLNSFENRVYQIGVYDEYKEYEVVAKFYRPGRWSHNQLVEEHSFTFELVDFELPVIAPIRQDQVSIFRVEQFQFAVFEKKGGRAPNLEDDAVLSWIGRLIGRIHAVSATQPFEYRPTINAEQFGRTPVRFIIENEFVPVELREPYQGLVDLALSIIDTAFNQNQDCAFIRLLGDCHPGNILWMEDGPSFVDLDDAVMGPAVQDLWMLLSGDRESMALQLRKVLMGYEQFMEFDYRQVSLIEPLRTLRIINYAGWLAQRWNDPAFKVAFPWFGSQRYWEEHMGHIREQIGLMQERFSI